MTEESAIMEELREIENVTEINGCFLLRARDNAIIESTIPLKIHDDILWEIAVLRDTFQQFDDGIRHGSLKDITLEGERGFIFINNLPPHFILLAMGSKGANLPIIQLAMIDIQHRLNQKIKAMGETLLNAPVKAFAVVGQEEDLPAYQAAGGKARVPKKVPIVSSSVSTARAAAEARALATAESRARGPIGPQHIATPPLIVKTPEPAKVPVPEAVTVVPEPAKVAPEVVEVVGGPDLMVLIQSIKGKAANEKYAILRNVFETLKNQIKTMTGVKLSGVLDTLKDMILDQCGTSLALFDISKHSRDFKNVQVTLSPQQVLQLRDRIDNWSQRIIK